MKRAIISICDFLIDHIVGTKPDNRFTAFFGSIANGLEQKQHILFDTVSARNMLILATASLIALA